ncbi:MAG: bifunctional metallophosphatase/5'-nucleotidase [Planctomycetes bacterium]|jgi:2',3'-cyclic-nucleotide 2'-phosphodiesterase (5'-nucleotidase family)|nr:bifunctional metallophosphatase/5'-nucleotidase [Planctomycetota bacterium]
MACLPHALAIGALALFAAAPLSAQAAPAPTPAPTPVPKEAAAADLVFLHWNDFHGQFRPQRAFWKLRPGLPDDRAPRLGGAAALAGFVQRERTAAAAAGRTVVVTDGGDWFQGTLEGNTSKGLLTIEFYNRLRLDAAALGNHEFDFGPDNLQRLLAAAKFPVLAANLRDTAAPAPSAWQRVRPFAVIDAHGLKIVVLGLITKDTKAVSTGPWGSAEFDDELQALRIAMPAAERAGDVVVLLTHCGVEVDRQLAKAFPQVPLILGGHSHTGLTAPLREGNCWIVQTHGKASEVWRVLARADREHRRLQLLGGELVELDAERAPPDTDTEQWFTAATAELTAHWDQPIGTLEIPPYDDRGARSSPAGNLVCDVFRAAAAADVAVTNKGGLRAHLASGSLTRRMLFELLPFDNTLVSMSLTGAQLRAVLQNSLAEGRRPLEIGGGSYRYTEQDGARQLLDVTIGDAPLDDARSYRVATSSFLARGGDGLSAFARGTDRRDHGVQLHQVLIEAAERDRGLRAAGDNRIEFRARDR